MKRTNLEESETKQCKTEENSNETLKYTWTEVKNNQACMYVYSSVSKIEPNHFTYIFDMDDTITKYDKKNILKDLEFVSPEVKPKLDSIIQKGDSIVILSNQAGVAQKHVTLSDVQKKIEKFALLFDYPLIICIAPYNDYYRKPCWGMYKYVNEHYYNNSLTKENCMYVGDGAGRKGKPKDFSDGDLLMSVNLDIPFQTPEVFFKNDKSSINVNVMQNLPAFNPKTVFIQKNNEDQQKLIREKLADVEMVVVIGSPASGKSTLSRTLFHDYVDINEDTYKTIKKCLNVAKSSLEDKKSVIIDNTNRDVKTRKQWIDLAKSMNIPVRALCLNTTKDEVFHLNTFRSYNIWREENRKVPSVVIHSFFKYLEKPTLNEGFARVDSYDFVAGPFKCEEEEKLFYSYL